MTNMYASPGPGARQCACRLTTCVRGCFAATSGDLCPCYCYGPLFFARAKEKGDHNQYHGRMVATREGLWLDLEQVD